MRVHTIWALGLLLAVTASASARAQVLEFGDEDLSNTGVYPTDPKAGATQSSLAPGVVTFATNKYHHNFPFTPSPSDFAGTDQIFVGSVQTANHEGYSSESSRRNGPQMFTLDYSSLLPAGNTLQTLTLGVAADDFQFQAFGQPYTATINGTANTALSNALDGLDQTGVFTQYLTVGIDPTLLNSSNVLTFSIDEGGDGGDGWSVDYLTVGVTSAPAAVPEPGSIALFVSMGIGGAGFLARRRCR